MRAFHRICAVFAAALMLYLGATGTLMQTIDLYTLLRHAPEADPVMLSINEGKYGNGDFPVLTWGDFAAAPLPQELDLAQALSTVLTAMHGEAPQAVPNFVELRVVRGVPIGQVRIGKEVHAFDARSGTAVTPLTVERVRVADSLRQNTKELHRFWSKRDLPGVWAELISGLIMWALIITGLVMYFRLLWARRKIGRSQLFWLAGGLWRGLHRVISVGAALFLIAVAFSGTWLGFESVWHTFAFNPTAARADTSAPLSDADILQMASSTLVALRLREPQTPIKVLRLRVYGTVKQGVVITGGGETRQLVFNSETGRLASLKEPGYPDNSGFPFGLQMHEDIKHFHSGFMFGLPARWMSGFAGLALMYLSVSGLVIYFQMWLKRRTSGRGGFVWV